MNINSLNIRSQYTEHAKFRKRKISYRLISETQNIDKSNLAGMDVIGNRVRGDAGGKTEQKETEARTMKKAR